MTVSQLEPAHHSPPFVLLEGIEHHVLNTHEASCWLEACACGYHRRKRRSIGRRRQPACYARQVLSATRGAGFALTGRTNTDSCLFLRFLLRKAR